MDFKLVPDTIDTAGCKSRQAKLLFSDAELKPVVWTVPLTLMLGRTYISTSNRLVQISNCTLQAASAIKVTLNSIHFSVLLT